MQWEVAAEHSRVLENIWKVSLVLNYLLSEWLIAACFASQL